MWPASYAKRLTSDLETWVANDWVTPDGAASIRASLQDNEQTNRLPVIITVLGAVLIGFAAMAFVAANWAEMSKGLRLGLLALAMWSAYGTAAILHVRRHAGFAEAALVVGVGLFGANIMLIGQMYHMPSDYSAGLLAWSLGALVTAWAVQSRAALVAAQLLIMAWTSTLITSGELHLTYLLPWAALTFLAVRLDWGPGKHLALIGFVFWLLGNAPVLAEDMGFGPVELASILSSVFIMMWVYGLVREHDGRSFARPLQAYAALAVLVLFWIGHVLDESIKMENLFYLPLAIAAIVAGASFAASQKVAEVRAIDIAALAAFPAGLWGAGILMGPYPNVDLWFSGPLLMLLCVWMVTFGTRLNNRFLINLGFVGFAGEALYLYLETFGDLLDTAAFFAIGGILLIAGGFIWERLRRRATTTSQAEALS